MIDFTFSTSSPHRDRQPPPPPQTELKMRARSVDDLEDRLDRLSLVCMAMWSLIQDKTKLTEEDLIERVRILDMMDGEVDGKAARGVKKCRKCGRTMNARHRKCLYCGAPEVVSSAFDAI